MILVLPALTKLLVHSWYNDKKYSLRLLKNVTSRVRVKSFCWRGWWITYCFSPKAVKIQWMAPIIAEIVPLTKYKLICGESYCFQCSVKWILSSFLALLRRKKQQSSLSYRWDIADYVNWTRKLLSFILSFCLNASREHPLLYTSIFII